MVKTARLTSASPLLRLAKGAWIVPLRLSLSTPGIKATVPMLRGVWGAALHDLDPEAYRAVFEGEGPPHDRQPGYVLRPAAPDSKDFPAIEWILLGKAADHLPSLLRAWDVASGMGLGPERRRFFVRKIRPISPDGVPRDRTAGTYPGWTLDKATWPLAGGPTVEACLLRFRSPLRLMRKRQLIERPILEEITDYGLRRLCRLLDNPAPALALRPRLAATAAAIAQEPWRGERLDLRRWSANQKEELEMRGVVGSILLPEGPGPLWPLLAMLRWIHLGKGTVFGLGGLEILPPT